VRPRLFLSPWLEDPRLTRRADDPEVYHGAPAAVQLLGCRLEEEKLLAIGQVVTDALKGIEGSGVSRGGNSVEAHSPSSSFDL
jgi:hypothetical protein